jgi:hypothetical protein
LAQAITDVEIALVPVQPLGTHMNGARAHSACQPSGMSHASGPFGNLDDTGDGLRDILVRFGTARPRRPST